MAEKERDEGTVAVLERPAEKPADTHVPDEPDVKEEKKKKRAKKNEKEIDEYEVELNTPFGKIEFEFEPKSAKERKDRERKEKAERESAKAAAKAEKQALKAAKKGKTLEPKRGGGKLLPILLIFAIVAGAIILAYWLFARPGEEDEIPAEFRNEPLPEQAPEPQGFVAKAQHRIKDAVRSGRQASREAQREQEQKFHDLTHQ